MSAAIPVPVPSTPGLPMAMIAEHAKRRKNPADRESGGSKDPNSILVLDNEDEASSSCEPKSTH